MTRRAVRAGAVIVGLGLLAAQPALAAGPYRIAPRDRAPGLAVLIPSAGTVLDSTYTGGQIFDWIGSLRVRIGVAGPSGGARAGSVAITVNRLGCTFDSGGLVGCTKISRLVPVRRLRPSGLSTVSITTPSWGCSRPQVTAQLVRPNGSRGPIVRWTPTTFCGE